MSESEYKLLVLADYDRKYLSGELSSELLVPTPGNLKAEGVRICECRFDRKDELLLQSFFNQKDGAAGYRLAIKNCKAEIFKPVIKLLKERNTNSGIKYINLLAWLIDFKPRPYRYGLSIAAPSVAQFNSIETRQPDTIEEKGITDEEKKGNITIKEREERVEIGPEKKVDEPVSQRGEITVKSFEETKKTNNRWFIGVAAFIVCGVFVLLFLLKNNDCMYWDNDRYLATLCDVPRLNTPIVRFDSAKIRGFRRIHHVDTLTHYSVGKLWYVRVGGIIEVYSAGGKHPIYPDKNLRLLTDYAVNVSQKQHGY